MRHSDRTVLVTGASSGIGLATVRRLASEGARIIAVARTAEKLAAALTGLPAVVATHAVDVADEAAVKQLADTLRAGGVALQGIVHAAGVHALRPLKVLNADELLRMYHSHVVSSVALCRHLTATKTWSGSGAAVFVSSAAALRASGGTIAYGAAKAALLAAMRTMAVELAPRGLRLNAVSPGVVLTPQSQAFLDSLVPEKRQEVIAEHPLGLGQPDDVAAAISFLLSDEARWITGANLVVDGGLTLQ